MDKYVAHECEVEAWEMGKSAAESEPIPQWLQDALATGRVRWPEIWVETAEGATVLLPGMFAVLRGDEVLVRTRDAFLARYKAKASVKMGELARTENE